MKKYIKGLVKVTSKECYAKNFRDGKLYMNELRYYTKCEQRELGDKLEGRSLTIYANNVPIQCIDSMALCFPVFCMYGLYDSKYGNTKFVSICPKMKAFGKYAVVVTDVQKFLERIEATGLEFSPVKYQNPDKNNYDSRIPFRPEYRKVKYFKYQQEFRIRKPDLLLTKNSKEKYEGLETKDEDHYEHFIPGGLHDITSEIIPIEKILQPNKHSVELSVDWENMVLSNFIKYEKPKLETKEDISR